MLDSILNAGASAGSSILGVVTWPTGLEPSAIVTLFTDYIYAAIPVVVGVMAVVSGIWYVIWTVRSTVTHKG